MPRTHVPRFDLTERFSFLEKKTTVLLHPRRGAVPNVWVSKFGGRIAWPRDEAWPVCPEHTGNPMIPVLQLRRADVPELGFPESKDLFQMLWCPQDHDSAYCSAIASVHWRNAESTGQLVEAAPASLQADPDYCPKECCLNFERVEELTSAWDLDNETDEAINTWIEDNHIEELERLHLAPNGRNYQRAFSVAPGTKVGGHIDWQQDPIVPSCACGKKMEHLLTIASYDYGGGDSDRWFPMDEPQEVYKMQGPGLELGDVGSFYVFICRCCDDMPIKSVFQCG